jgi:cobalamin biosynthetic protein CobC
LLEHGGNLTAAALRYGIPLEIWLDLSTGINPHGYPIPEIPQSAWQRLPPTQDGLIEAAKAYYGAPYLLATSGSQAILQALPRLRAPAKVATLSPAYAEHAYAWSRCGHEITTFTGMPDEKTLNNVDVIVLCNPNNPTAQQFQPADLLKWHAQLAKRGGWLVVDEAFMDATPEFSLAKHVHFEGLFVLRSLGKFFGLAGARVGFLLAAEQHLSMLEEYLGPWPLTGAARIIATQALRDNAWQQQTRAQLLSTSTRLVELLGQYGLQPQAGTHLFQWVTTANAEAWHTHLAQQGIWVRKFAEVSALRFGLPPEDGWVRLETALKTFPRHI